IEPIASLTFTILDFNYCVCSCKYWTLEYTEILLLNKPPEGRHHHAGYSRGLQSFRGDCFQLPGGDSRPCVRVVFFKPTNCWNSGRKHSFNGPERGNPRKASKRISCILSTGFCGHLLFRSWAAFLGCKKLKIKTPSDANARRKSSSLDPDIRNIPSHEFAT